MTYNVDIDLDEILDWLAAAERAPELAEQEALIAMRKAVGEVERQTVDRTPVNTGALRAAWSTKVSKGARAVKGEVLNPLVYAIVMEKGRRAGARMPPVDAIQYWVTRKFGVSGVQAEGIAFVIARSISRKGIKGRKMLEEGLRAAEPTVRRIFDDVPENVWRKLT